MIIYYYYYYYYYYFASIEVKNVNILNGIKFTSTVSTSVSLKNPSIPIIFSKDQDEIFE